MRHTLPRRGFTLIEVLTVIVVISILTSVIYVGFSGARENARNKAMLTTLKETQLALELYKAQNGSYPVPTSAECGPAYPASPSAGNKYTAKYSQGGVESCPRSYMPGLVPEYLEELPSRLMSNNSECEIWYTYQGDGSRYKLMMLNCYEGADTAADGLQAGDEFARYPVSCSGLVGYNTAAPEYYRTPAVYSPDAACMDLSGG